MRLSAILFFVAVIITGVAVAQEKPAAPAPAHPAMIMDQEFEQDASGWTGLGATAKVRTTTSDAHAGKGALAFDYEVQRGQLNLLTHPVADGALRTMGHLRFWLKTDTATNVGVILQEKGEGRYTATLWSAKDTWQEVDLAPNEFALAQDANDPKDSDGRLDLDKVDTIGILDAGQALVQIPENPDVPLLFDRRTGKRTLLIDDFRAVEGSRAASNDKFVVDDFNGSVVKWVALGGTPLTLSATGNPLGTRAIELTYDAGEKIVIISRSAPHVDLSQAKTFSFQIATRYPASIALSLETRKLGQSGGTRYNYIVETIGDGKPTKTTVPFDSFEWDENSVDPGEPMNLGNLRTISVADLAGAMGASAKNTLWVGPIRAN